MKLSIGVSTYGLTGLLCALGASQAGLSWYYARSDAAVLAPNAAAQSSQPSARAGVMRELIALLGLVSILATGGLSAHLLRRRLVRPLAGLRTSLESLAERRVDDARTHADDFAAMAQDLASLRSTLARALHAENALRDNASALIMTDAEFMITSVNTQCQALLRAHTQEIRKAIPDFELERLVGRSIDSLHLRATQPASQLLLGAAEFTVTAWPVRDSGSGLPDSPPQGYVVELRDATIQRRAEREIVAMVQGLAAGRFSERLGLDGKAGFVRALAEQLNTTSTALQALLNEAQEALAALARQDLTVRMQGSHAGACEDLRQGVNAAADAMAETLSRLQDHAAKLHGATQGIQGGAGDLAERTSRQASTLQETAAATEQLSRTVADNSARADLARTSAASAQANVEHSAEVARSATQAMGQIVDSSQRISEIISLIDDIAFQTNLLALNASVEAARAGDAGKGFAVVASEVRRLAQSAAQASAEVKSLIQASSVNVRTGVDLVERSALSLRKIETDVRTLSGVVEAMAGATREQAHGLQHVHVAVKQMDEITQQNSILAEKTNAAVALADLQARDLDATIGGFRLARSAAPVSSPRPPAARAAPSAPASPIDARPRPSPARDLQVRVRRSVTAGPAPSNAPAFPAARADDDWSEF